MDNKPVTKSQLIRKAIMLLVLTFWVLAAGFFLPAGTWAYWQAWVYMAVLFIPIIGVCIYLIKYDPELLQRRLQLKERTREQRKIIYLAYPFFILMFLLPGFDRRFGWSNVSLGVVIAANIIVLLGYGFFFLVLRENSYASRIVEIQPEQQVISSGPYTIVRHPMYLGLLFFYIFTPLALGSWVSVIPALSIIPILVARIRNEEKTLVQDLKGYQKYTQKTRYRLIPGLW